MSVTQDYKILTLTRSEYQAVAEALTVRKGELMEYIAAERYETAYMALLRCMLADVQTTIVKVQA
jgi:hypothetical protein